MGCIVAHLWYTFNIDSKNVSIMIPINKSAYLTVRVSDKTRTKFHAKAKKFGTPSEVLRELIDAFIEDRVTIQPSVNRNLLEKLYVTRSEN
jgi:hypothetical protein